MAENVKSVKKTIDILNCFIKKEQLGITEISEMLGLNKSNVYDIVRTLKNLNFLEQDQDSEKYYLSVGVLKLAHAVGGRYAFRNVAKIFMEEIAEQLNEEVNLSVPMQTEVFFLDVVRPIEKGYAVSKQLKEFTIRMHCTASGKSMLAFMPREKVYEYLNTGLEAVTEYTITNDIEFLKELDVIRENGYAIGDREHKTDELCIAVPLFNRKGELLGAMSVSGKISAFSDEKKEKAILLLRKAAVKISEAV